MTLLCGCTAPRPPVSITRWPSRVVTYRVETDIPGAVKAARLAAAEWSRAGVVTLRYVDGAADIVIHGADLSGSVAGFGYFPPYGLLHLDTSKRVWSRGLLYRVLLHEFGHCLGLTHEGTWRGDVMYFRVRQRVTLSRGDVARLAALYGE